MVSTSDKFKQIASGEHKTEIQCVIGNVGYTQGSLISVSTSHISMGNEAPSCGNACAGTITIDMLPPNKEIQNNEKIRLLVRVLNDTQTSEWITHGIFYVDTRKNVRNSSGETVRVHIEGYDGMVNAEQTFIPTGGATSFTDDQLLTQVCTQAKLFKGFTCFRGYTIPSVPSDMTCREIIGYLAAMYGMNAVVDYSGNLRFINLHKQAPSTVDVTAGKMYAGRKLAPLRSVILHKMDGTKWQKTSSTATGTYSTMNIDTPWATETICQNILDTITGYEYQPYEIVDSDLNPAIEIGDVINFNGINERIYNCSINFRGGVIASISAPEVNECSHDYQPQSVSGGIGGGGGGLGLSSSAKSKEMKTVKRELLASVGDVSSGLRAIATDGEIEGLKAANTTLFAKVLDKTDNTSLISQVELNTKSTADLKEADAKMEAVIFDDSGNSKVASKVELSTKLDADGYANASAVMSAASGDAVASIEAIASESSGGSKTLVQILSDSVNLNNIAYVNKGQGQQNDTLSVRGSTSMSGNLLVAGDISLPNSDSVINIGYDVYSPKEIAFALDPTTKQKLTDFWVLGK